MEEIAEGEPIPEGARKVVRHNHLETVHYMTSSQFKKIKEVVDSAVPSGVYFRPLESGVRLIDLGGKSKPRIGIGPILARNTLAEDFQTRFPQVLLDLKATQEKLKSQSVENQLEARLIREAQGNGLRLPDFDRTLYFIHSQWRLQSLEKKQTQKFTDLIAVDPLTKGLVIIELKLEQKDRTKEQARGYRDYFRKNAVQLVPFFQEVAQMMGALYDCEELMHITLDPSKIDAVVAWPTSKESDQLSTEWLAD